MVVSPPKRILRTTANRAQVLFNNGIGKDRTRIMKLKGSARPSAKGGKPCSSAHKTRRGAMDQGLPARSVGRRISHPDRAGCPGHETLRALAFRKLGSEQVRELDRTFQHVHAVFP